MTRMIRIALLAWTVLLTASIWAQANSSQLDSSAISASTLTPSVTYSQKWPDATPPYFVIEVDPGGRASYRSTSKAAASDDPYELKFVVSEQTRARIFDLAKQLNFFQGSFDYTKSKIAFTGTKTLTFKNGGEEHQTSYNWSQEPGVQELTNTFQNISETIELGRQLADKYRFDKLGVDAELKLLEEAAKSNRVAEVQSIEPILSRIAKDPNMMNISRRRAELLLAKILPGARLSGHPSSAEQ